VFVEITEKNLNKNKQNQKNNGNSETSVSNTERIKLDILKKENRILDETNRKFLQANQLLKSQTNELNIKVTNLQNKIDIQEEKIKQDNTDKDELEFLKLNLIYSSKCTRTVFKKGYKVGTTEYKECILRRGKKIND
jgi:rod shape-determining protein MreC